MLNLSHGFNEKISTIRKLFEKWMKKEFDEPDWYEGYNRGSMLESFKAGFKAGRQSRKKAIEQIHSEIISKISDMLPCNPNLHQSVSKEILETLHKYLD